MVALVARISQSLTKNGMPCWRMACHAQCQLPPMSWNMASWVIHGFLDGPLPWLMEGTIWLWLTLRHGKSPVLIGKLGKPSISMGHRKTMALLVITRGYSFLAPHFLILFVSFHMVGQFPQCCFTYSSRPSQEHCQNEQHVGSWGLPWFTIYIHLAS